MSGRNAKLVSTRKKFQQAGADFGNAAGRAEFISILESHLADRGFCSDMDQLLRTGTAYDPHKAGEYVKASLLKLLPE